MTTLRGPEFAKMPALRSDELAWIPSLLEPVWSESCKPARVARHCEALHKEIPGRVSAEHVCEYRALAATESEEAISARYATMAKFVWPLSKQCPAIDPAAPRVYARHERPREDIDQEANPPIRGERGRRVAVLRGPRGGRSPREPRRRCCHHRSAI